MPDIDCEGVIKGFRLYVHVSLSTPLRLLLRHLEFLPQLPAPEDFPDSPYAVWLPATKTYRELGIDLADPNFTMASAFGQIPESGGEYLRFMIALKEIAETVNPIEERIKAIQRLALTSDFMQPINRLGGIGTICQALFPRFIDRLSYLSDSHRVRLQELGIFTPRQIQETGLDVLRKMKGIGPKKLEHIAKQCEQAAFPDDVYIDNVVR